MEDLTQIAQLVPDAILASILLWLLVSEQKDHRRTRRNLAKVHARHKQDLRKQEQKSETPAE